MAFIKSTNENLYTLNHLYDSLYNHLGWEYMDTAKTIIEQNVLESDEYSTLANDFEKAEEEWNKEKSHYLNRHADTREAIYDLIHSIEEAPRLNRKNLIKELKFILTS